MSGGTDPEEKVRQLGFDLLSARQWAAQDRVEAWVHCYLCSGLGGRTDPEFSAGLKAAARWWNGPLELPLSALSPAVGIQPGMEYVVDREYWEKRTEHMARTLSSLERLPPLIAEYRAGELSVRDGNTRHAAMQRLGWQTCWVIIWYNSESDYCQHYEILFGRKTA